MPTNPPDAAADALWAVTDEELRGLGLIETDDNAPLFDKMRLLGHMIRARVEAHYRERERRLVEVLRKTIRSLEASGSAWVDPMGYEAAPEYTEALDLLAELEEETP